MSRVAKKMWRLRVLVTAPLLACALTLAADPARPPARVVTLAPHLAELVCDAGACARLVGVSARSNDPPAVRALPQVGDAFAVNLEVLLSLKPDLVLAWNGGMPDATIARLRDLGLRVEAPKVADLDDIANALEGIGDWLGTAVEARRAASAYRQRLASLRARWAGATPVRFVYQIETQPAYVVSRRSPISQAVEVCGGINVFAELPAGAIAAQVGPESMLAAAPEAVLFGGDDNAESMRDYWSRIPTLSGSKKPTLYSVNADWLARATPRVLDGIEEVCGDLDAIRNAH